MKNQYLQIELDSKGFPVFRDSEDSAIYLATAKINKTQSNVSGMQRNAHSGNPWFDPGTGRFANGPVGVKTVSGGGLMKNILNSGKQFISEQAQRLGADSLAAIADKEGRVKITLLKSGIALTTFSVPSKATSPQQSHIGSDMVDHSLEDTGLPAPPAGVDPEEWMRRQDSVRDAARKFNLVDHQQIVDFLQNRAHRKLSQHEINQLMSDIHRQRLDDLVDYLDLKIKGQTSLRKLGKTNVKVVIIGSWFKKTLGGLENADIAEVHRRLLARGNSEEELDRSLLSRLPADRKEDLVSFIGGIDKSGNATKVTKPDENSSSDNRGNGSQNRPN